MKAFIVTLVAGFLMITNAWSQSEDDYRYTIRGYVLDENRQAMANQDVRVYRGRVLLEIVKTDTAGYYSLKLLLHNSDNQQILRLRAGEKEAEIRVTFDTEGITRSRVHEANFVAGKLIEGRLSHYVIPPWIYPIVGLIAIILLAVKLEKRRKKKIQLKKDKLSGRQSLSSHNSKKKKRRKH